MSNQVLYISRPAYISSELEQLVIQFRDQERNEVRRPCENIIFLELDNPQITITHGALAMLMRHSVIVLTTTAEHLPSGLITPFIGNSLQGRVQQAQWENQTKAAPFAWKKIIEAKIKNQLAVANYVHKPLTALSRVQVHSGDRTNAEARVARQYFPNLFSESFIRDPDGEFPNSFLNYGYAILRGIMARAIVTSGLQLAPGIFHRNQYNPFPLADDLMEPFRPLVDLKVFQWQKEFPENQELNKQAKQYFLSLIHEDVLWAGKQKPTHQAMNALANQFVHYLTGTGNFSIMPELCL